ncbi:hypothetical protein PHISP_05304 [Aspergillus sp. HF37]|nr:hypothetical protein PHISP_05304 [Aspergillus sp. HF37]
MRKIHNTSPPNAPRFNGTLLPRPARYLLTKPENGRGLGNVPSSWNLNRLSSTRTAPATPELRGLGTGDGPPLRAAKVLAPPGETGAEEEHWGELALKEGKSEEAVGVLPAQMKLEVVVPQPAVREASIVLVVLEVAGPMLTEEEGAVQLDWQREEEVQEPTASWRREAAEALTTPATEVVHGEVPLGWTWSMKSLTPLTTAAKLALEEVSAGLQLKDWQEAQEAILTTAEEAEDVLPEVLELPAVLEQAQREDLSAHSLTLGDTGNLDLLRYQCRLDCAVSASHRRKSRQAGELLEGSRRYLVQRPLRCCFEVGLHLDPKEQAVLARLAASPYRELGGHPQPEGLKFSLLLSKPPAQIYHSSQPSSSGCLC